MELEILNEDSPEKVDYRNNIPGRTSQLFKDTTDTGADR